MVSTGTDGHLTDILLSKFDLPDEVRWGLPEAGFVFATPIQAATLPLTLKGRDVAGQAQTGTGKTAAFLITIFSRLLRKPRRRPAHGPRALVIAPTRELVVQIRQDAELFGRLTDYEGQKATTFRDVEILVIDEADRMFDMGFIRDLRKILRRCPPFDQR